MARYIDADELIVQIEGNTAETWGKGLGRAWWAHSVMLKDNIVNLIRNAPTADVVSEIFGEIDEAMTDHARGEIDDHWLYVRIEEIKKKYTGGK